MHITHRFLALAAAASLYGKALCSPITIVSPGDANSIIIGADNTLNATAPPPINGGDDLNTLATTSATERRLLVDQTHKDGHPWGDLCQATAPGQPLRIIAPIDFISTRAAAFAGYFTDYTNQVLARYATEPLTINTQSAGNVACHAGNGFLTCDGDNRPYNLGNMSSMDVFGCNSGPFAIDTEHDNAIHKAVVPRLCAAFNRGTLLLPEGNL